MSTDNASRVLISALPHRTRLRTQKLRDTVAVEDAVDTIKADSIDNFQGRKKDYITAAWGFAVGVPSALQPPPNAPFDAAAIAA